MLTISRPSNILFMLGCFAIPFYNDTGLFLGISEIFRSPSTLIFLLSLLLLGVEQLVCPGHIRLRHLDICFISGLVVLVFFSFITNIRFSGYVVGEDITGIQKMLSSSANMIILLIFLLFYTHMLKVINIQKLLKYIKFGFILTLVYVSLEIINYVIPISLAGGGKANSHIMDAVDSFVHVRDRAPGMPRARGFAFEPSYLVAVLFFLLPFLVADKSRYRPYILIGWLLCVWATDSPTGIVALLVFLVFYWFSVYISIAICVLCALFLSIAVLGIYQGFIDVPIDKMESTATRVGSWVSSLVVLKDNPIFGVGPGMHGYWVIHNYPDFFWTIRDPEVWVNLGVKSFDAPTFATILTIALSLGLAPICYTIIYLILTRRIKEIAASPLARSSAASMFVVSFGLNGYTFLGYWILFAITLSGKWGDLERIRIGKEPAFGVNRKHSSLVWTKSENLDVRN